MAATARPLKGRKYGKARGCGFLTEGILSEENLAALRQQGGQYLVGTARKKLNEFERELLEGGWQQVRPEVDVKMVSTPGGEETYVLCRTGARKQREQAIRESFLDTEGECSKETPQASRRTKTKGRHKIERQIGRI